jgi:hypothetical protein
MKHRLGWWVAALVAGAAGAEDGAPYFVKQDSWLETVVASRTALAGQETQAAQTAQARKQGDALLKNFDAQDFTLTGQDEPRTLKLNVAGLSKLYLGSLGPRPVFVSDARLLNARGAAVALQAARLLLTKIDQQGNLRHDKENGWKPVKSGKRVFANGMELNHGEVTLELGGKFETLEVTLGVPNENPNDKRPTRVWVSCASVAQQEMQHGAALDKIWTLAAAAFPGPVAHRERWLEEAADIWRTPWQGNDWSELAGRYAKRCGKLSGPARELAKRCQSLADVEAVRGLFYVPHAEERLALAEKTLAFVEQAAPRPEFAAQLKALQAQLPGASAGKISGEKLYAQACVLRRNLILSHPLLDFPTLLINKRSGHLPEHMCDQYLGRHSQAAPGLVLLENWKAQPKQTALLADKLPRGATLQPDLAPDGRRVLFAFADHADPRGAQDSQLRGYFIYEYSFDTKKVRQITGTARDPLEGRDGRQTVLIEDTDPCYLPDGGLAFISTRSQQYGRCHGSRYVPAYTLYRADATGGAIRALSYNESNEWAPSVLSDGSLGYCRWDYVDRHDVQFQSLWTIRPDGTQTAHYYGNNSAAPCLISEPQAIPGSHKTVSTCGAHHGQTFGTLVTVDPRKGQEGGAPLTWLTPELGFPESGVPAGITRTTMPPAEDARGGRAGSPWPLSEDLFLCAYKPGPDRTGHYAIYLVDTLGGRELICADDTISCCDPVPLRPRVQPPAIPSTLVAKSAERTGVFSVEDVYQSSTPFPRGTIKALRINQIISKPTRSSPSRSQVANQLVKKVLGTVPVNADGSVAFEAPSDQALQFQLLDEHGLAVMTMRSLVYLQPGEKAACVGCHEPRSSAPPPAANPRLKVQPLTPPAGPHYAGGFSYMRSVQPVLDRHCIRCHGLAGAAGGLDLTGEFSRADPAHPRGQRQRTEFSSSYLALLGKPGLVATAKRNVQTAFSVPKDYFAAAGCLAPLLLAGHPAKDGTPRVQLDQESFQRIVDWLDLNAQFYGDYSHNRIETQPPSPAGEKALRAAIEKRFGVSLAQQPLAALVNLAQPDESRILRAPLPAAAGGWGQLASGAYRDRSDPAYQDMCQLVAATLTPPPFRDVADTCGHPDRCSCGNCWVRQDLLARLPRPPQ